MQEQEDLLADGWTVVPFAMADADARPSPWSRFFVRERDYRTPRLTFRTLGDALSLIWNGEAAANLEALVRETRPGLAHLHNIYHHLSPSILRVLRKHQIPVVMTLHDLRLLCPAIHMLRAGQVCEECKDGKLYNAVRYACVKESRAASLLASLETFHQRTRHLYEDAVDLFLCPSRFIRDKYLSWGFPAAKLRRLPNFVDLDLWHPRHLSQATPKDAYLFFGRISREKGLRTLLDAQSRWEKGYRSGKVTEPPLRLLVAGTGPCEGNLRARAVQLELESVEILGNLDRPGLLRALGRSRFSVLPSECYENAPMAALEALACGIPVVGTNLGGIPEMIEDQVTGVVVPPQNPAGLLAGLIKAAQLGPEAGRNARAWAETHASRADHMARLQEIFEEVSA
jgi:glycosyltransferase involved in cell wall biosynthesis